MGEPFLQDVLRFYGSNDSLSTANLENFLQLITSRRAPASIDNAANPLRSAECLSLSDLLSVYGLNNVSEVSVDQLELMCPAVLTQILLPSCPYMSSTGQSVSLEVWGYGFLAVTIINLASLLGLFLVPFTKKSYFPKVLTYFIGVAIGTLFSNAVLQLIPEDDNDLYYREEVNHLVDWCENNNLVLNVEKTTAGFWKEALGFDPKADDYVSNAVGIFGGFYLLFFTERVLKIVLKADSEDCHSHFPSMQTTDVTASNDIVISNISNDVITNNINHDVLPNSPREKANSPTTSPVVSPVNEQEACVLLACRWLRGERISNIKTMAWMITLSDALHNFIDGLAIGASFTLSLLIGFSTSIAIVCEEFPHEIGDFVILLSSGMSVPQAVFFNLLSAMCCYLGLVLGILLGSSFAPNVIFAIAGGMFLYISLTDMFAEMNGIMMAHTKGSREKVIFFLFQNGGLLTGFTIILLITMFAGDINLG